MKIAVRHQLSIALPAGTPRAVLHILATPQTGPSQTVREWKLDAPGLDGAPSFIDAFGNRARLVTLTKPEQELTLSISGIVETIDRNGVLGRAPGEPVPALFRRTTPGAKAVGAITSRLRGAPRDGADRIPLLHTVMARVGEHVGGAATAAQSQTQAQDAEGQTQAQIEAAPTPPASEFAQAFVGSARALGIPARYVSGYLSGDGGAAAMHAWAEAWDDGLGWIGFDPMLGVCPADRHIRVASGLDAGYVAMVRSVPAVGAPAQLSLTVDAVQ
jgi:transglutaminase-like putative cysteine protease